MLSGYSQECSHERIFLLIGKRTSVDLQYEGTVCFVHRPYHSLLVMGAVMEPRPFLPLHFLHIALRFPMWSDPPLMRATMWSTVSALLPHW